jgi:hypothetical protein
MVVFRHCKFRYFCYFCNQKEKKAHEMSDNCEKFINFAVAISPITEELHFFEGSANAYLQVDESRQLIMLRNQE